MQFIESLNPKSLGLDNKLFQFHLYLNKVMISYIQKMFKGISKKHALRKS